MDIIFGILLTVAVICALVIMGGCVVSSILH
jgi:hypothetical protein